MILDEFLIVTSLQASCPLATMMTPSEICKANVGRMPLLSVLVVSLIGTSSASRSLLANLYHHEIRPMPQAPLAELDPMVVKFRPRLFSNGCAPHSAVSANGDTNGGKEVLFLRNTFEAM